MWIQIARTRDALAALWLPWERLHVQGPWPGVFATAAGFQWLLRYGGEPVRPWVLARWQGRRLTGLLPLLAPSHPASLPGELCLPPLVQAPLGGQPTVFLLQLFEGWQRLGGQASGICGSWPWAGTRPGGRWVVAARWRHWTFRPQRPAWVVLPDPLSAVEPSDRCPDSACFELSTTLKDSFQEDWDKECWNGWTAGLSCDPLAWWHLAELLQRHRRLLLARLRRSSSRSAWLLAAREPQGLLLLARSGIKPQEESWLEMLRQASLHWQGAALRWIVPSRWIAQPEESRGSVWYHWRLQPPRAGWRRWLDRLRPQRGLLNKKRRPVSKPAW